MKILAIEASGQTAGCALLDEDILAADYNIQFKKTHSQSLMPMLDEIRKMIRLDMNTVDAIAVTAGPGSFTGLRIGAATAKGLGLALDIPLIGISTLEAIAYNMAGAQGLICPIMDARRQQVYNAVYRWNSREEDLDEVKAQKPVDIRELIAFLNDRGEPVTFLGDGVPVYRNIIEAELHVPFHFAPAHLSRQRAGTLASIAMHRYRKHGKDCMVSSDDFRPEYLRMAQAERERMERGEK